MLPIFQITLLMIVMNTILIFDFEKDSDISNWRIVDDVVMGGRSSGDFKLTDDGYGEFSGSVSLENNGGFSSVRYNFDKLDISGKNKIIIRLKGDGKRYQFRLKDDRDTYYSFITYFETSGDWEDIEISLNDMYPSFRGRKLDLPNYSASTIEEISFLIANKKKEEFRLLIDKIEVR